MIIEDSLFNWALEHAPGIALGIALSAAAVWLTVHVIGFQNRLTRVESDQKVMKKDIKSLKKAVIRIDRRLTRLEEKIGSLITFLTTRKSDFKD